MYSYNDIRWKTLTLSFVAGAAGDIKYSSTDPMVPRIIPSHELSNTLDKINEDVDSVTSLQQLAPENLPRSGSRKSSDASEKNVNGRVQFERVCLLVNLSKNVT